MMQEEYSWVEELGWFLGGGTGVVLGSGTGVFLRGGFPLGVVYPGPPMDASKGFGVLAPRPSSGHEVCHLKVW